MAPALPRISNWLSFAPGKHKVLPTKAQQRGSGERNNSTSSENMTAKINAVGFGSLPAPPRLEIVISSNYNLCH